MKSADLVLAALLCLLPGGLLLAQTAQFEARAEVARSTAPAMTPLKAAGLLALVEGLAALNGVMAAELPGVYGSVMTIGTMISVPNRLNGAGEAAFIAGGLALAQYDFNYVSNKPDAKRRRFWVTFAGIQAVPLLASGVDRMTGGPKARRAASSAAAPGWRLYALPAEGGAALLLARRF